MLLIDTGDVRWELPPRARRIQRVAVTIVGDEGTTSACAENTGNIQVRLDFMRNYLRVRGEYSKASIVMDSNR